jgi:hypothetical protein
MNYKPYSGLSQELDKRDMIFRRKLHPVHARNIPPWSFVNNQHKREIWNSLHSGEINESEAVSKMTNLMEAYYQMDFPF